MQATSSVERSTLIESVEHQCRGECETCLIERRAIESVELSDNERRASRAASRLAARVRAAIARIESDRREIEGYSMLDRSMVRAISDMAESTAARYVGIDAGLVASETLSKYARWLAGIEDIERRERAMSDKRYARSIARRMAHQLASRAAIGTGSMPRLSVDASEIQRRERAIFRNAGISSPHSITTATHRVAADMAAVDPTRFSAGSWLDTVRGERLSESGRVESVKRRALSESERELIELHRRHERVESSPNYSPWLDAYGESVAAVGVAHPVGHHAPGVPHRDAPSLRRGSLIERLTAVDRLDVVPAIRAARSMVERGDRFSWDRVAAAIQSSEHRATIARRVRAAIESVERIESDRGYAYPGDSLNVASIERASIESVPTGRFIESSENRGRGWNSAVWLNGWQWRKVEDHASECTPKPFLLSVPCVDGCHAMALVPASRPLIEPTSSEDIERLTSSIDPYASLRRSLWLARWHRVSDDTPREIVRAIIERRVSPRPRPTARPIP